MMKNKEQLEQLIKAYKTKKTDIIFNQIYKILLSTIKQKTNFIYYHKWYPFNLYNPCHKCRTCTKLNAIPKSEHNLICRECKVCKCKSIERGFFNLNKNGVCEYKDVLNDLWMEIVRIIDNYDMAQEFNKYLFATLWEWIPSFLTKEFIKSISDRPLIYTNEEGNEREEFGEEGEIGKEKIDKEKQAKTQEKIKQILDVCYSKREKELVNLFLTDKRMTQEKASQILGISQPAICLILKTLQKRLKIDL